ncbi:hypothetical protein V6N11_076165 [Hibiscus sabdariffa]|uniref:Uncharacterized protein n=1 Tax=Hibiscus sabdariffa TaxID=183260 RepID=A0ABR2Q610_9ROSI
MAPFCVRCLFRRNSNKRFKSRLMNNVKKHKKGGIENIQEKYEKLTVDMKEIREAQRQVREKFEGVANECEELKRETRIIVQQTARTQVKLALMFQIVKASEQADHATVSTLTHLLRIFLHNKRRLDLPLVLLIVGALCIGCFSIGYERAKIAYVGGLILWETPSSPGSVVIWCILQYPETISPVEARAKSCMLYLEEMS